MDLRYLLVSTLLIGGAIGLLLPSEEDMARLSGNAQNPEVEDPAMLSVVQGADAKVAWAEDVALERQHDGHFYVDVMIDGVSTRMLVDTGASVIALTGDDAMAMGLYWNEGDIRPVAQGASGVVYGTDVKLPRVAVGGFEAENVDALIIPEGLGISLLGQSFLSTVGDVRISDGRMVLGHGE